jgi:hypothetical protein
MKTLTRFAFTMSAILLSTAGLSGCNSSPSQVSPPSSNGATARGHGPPSAAAHGLRAGHHRSGTSWIKTPLTDRQLLYISDTASDVVDVYGYPSRAPVGQLFGFNEPQGECADSRGDVYVTNTGTSQIYVYPPASGTLLETINDPGGFPVGCAVGPEGELAVTNIFSSSYGPGSISLYNGSNTIPTIITSPSFENMYFDGFDAKNNLFVDGLNPSGVFQLGKLPSGSNTITPITVSGASIEYPGGVQVTAGPKVNVGDQLGEVVYRMSEGGVVNGHTSLSGASDCVQGTIVVGKPVSKGVFICPDAGTADTEFFKYTAGGSPTQTITGFEEPIGSVISGKPPPPNPPAEIFNFFQKFPCTYGSQGCPTDFEIAFTGNITAFIPSTEPLYGPYNPFCPPTQGPNNPCPPTVTYDTTSNKTIVEFSGATLYQNTHDCNSFGGQPCVHYGLLASQNQTQGLWGFQETSYWTYGTPLRRKGAQPQTYPPPQPAPIISIASKQPVMSSKWKYAIVFVSASTQATGTASYGSWWAIGYVPKGKAQPIIQFRNYGTQTLYVKSSGILLNQPVPTDLACLSNPACQENMAILATENSDSLPPPGTSGSPFTPLANPPKVLKPYQ